MSGMINASFMAANSRKFLDQYSKITIGKGTTKSFSEYKQKKLEETERTERAVLESAVDDYKKRHPESASHVDTQVNAGKAVRKKNGAEHISTEDMTMEEYQSYFNALLDTIPYDPTRMYDETVLTISDDGWEQMKKDSDYEAWILGYFVEDRAVRNPFFGWGGNGGSMIIEKFGASIDEHNGVGYSKSSSMGVDTRKSDSLDSWWIKRHKRMKKIIHEQGVKAQKRSAKMRETAQQEFQKQQWESRQRLTQFLNSENQNGLKTFTSGHSPFLATTVYDNLISTFSSELMSSH